MSTDSLYTCNIQNINVVHLHKNSNWWLNELPRILFFLASSYSPFTAFILEFWAVWDTFRGELELDSGCDTKKTVHLRKTEHLISLWGSSQARLKRIWFTQYRLIVQGKSKSKQN